MVEQFRVHDLLWGFTPEQLPVDAPQWCLAALRDAPPVVMRRAESRPGWVPIGLRGAARGERFAGWLPVAAVSAVLSPEQLRLRDPADQSGLAVWRALTKVRPLLESCGLHWGVTGSAGFELATGRSVTHAGSDLDLLLRTPQPISREHARRLLEPVTDIPCRIDVQLQTPHGGVALAEWAGRASKVMLKGVRGPALVANPWEGIES